MKESNWGFSRREKIGMFGIASIIAILFLANMFYTKASNKNDKQDISSFQKAIEEANKERALIAQEKKDKKNSFRKTYKNQYKNNGSKTKSSIKSKVESKPISTVEQNEIAQKVDDNLPKIEMSFFNPNNATLDELAKLGIPKRTCQTIINFRNKGGKFLKAEDLKVVYGISEPIYKRLKQYIQIPDVVKKKKDIPKEKVLIKIPLNGSTAEDWMKLRGIGPTLSARIVKYRDKLGGFANVEQLKDVYNLPDSTFNSIYGQIELNNSIVKKSIQELNFKELISHPYINKSIAGKLISKKDRNEKFNNWQEFQNYLKITPKEVENIKQYFIIP